MEKAHECTWWIISKEKTFKTHRVQSGRFYFARQMKEKKNSILQLKSRCRGKSSSSRLRSMNRGHHLSPVSNRNRIIDRTKQLNSLINKIIWISSVPFISFSFIVLLFVKKSTKQNYCFQKFILFFSLYYLPRRPSFATSDDKAAKNSRKIARNIPRILNDLKKTSFITRAIVVK